MPDAHGGIRIILADDHPVVRSGVRAILERNGGARVVAETEKSMPVSNSSRRRDRVDLPAPEGEDRMNIRPRRWSWSAALCEDSPMGPVALEGGHKSRGGQDSLSAGGRAVRPVFAAFFARRLASRRLPRS